MDACLLEFDTEYGYFCGILMYTHSVVELAPVSLSLCQSMVAHLIPEFLYLLQVYMAVIFKGRTVYTLCTDNCYLWELSHGKY